jgi:hypothetical protein
MLLLLVLPAACSRGREDAAWDQGPFPGVHLFEGRVSDAPEGSGGNYVLAVGDELYALQGNNEEIGRYAGQAVEVRASVDGNTLRVVRIDPQDQRSPGG